VITVVDAGQTSGDNGVIIEPTARPDRFRGWRHYVEVTAARLARNFPGAALGADIVFASDLPRAAGMSSSSALVVGTATALIHVAHLRDRDEWRSNVRTTVDEAGYLACIENGRTFGTLAGDGGVGTHGGSEDHAAMVAGTARACTGFAFVPLRHLATVPMPEGWSVVVATSGIGSHKTGTERDAYNRLSEGARVLQALWNASHPACASLADALASSPDALEELHRRIREAAVDGWSAQTLGGRLAHFTGEDRRVGDAMLAIRNADRDAVGRLSAESQTDAEQRLRNQLAETSALVRVARDTGAFAARSFGAGFGGSAWAMVDHDAGGFAGRWLTAYRREHPDAGARALAFVANPGPPVIELS
jgi:galactokinase